MSELLSSVESYRSPEELAERSLEWLDMTHEMERIFSLIIESGPELDPAYVATLRDYLDDLIRRLNIPLSEPTQFVQDRKESMGVTDDIVTDILAKHSLPETMREVIEKIIAAKHENLTDKAIYRRLARVYHPDQTILDPESSEEVFKFIGQKLYDDEDGFSSIFESARAK